MHKINNAFCYHPNPTNRPKLLGASVSLLFVASYCDRHFDAHHKDLYLKAIYQFVLYTIFLLPDFLLRARFPLLYFVFRVSLPEYSHLNFLILNRASSLMHRSLLYDILLLLECMHCWYWVSDFCESVLIEFFL